MVQTEPGPYSSNAQDTDGVRDRPVLAGVRHRSLQRLQGVPWSDWPVYVVNKAVALSSLLLLLAWILRARLGPDESSSSLLSLARRFALVHAGLSLAILSPAYFPTFFSGGRLNWAVGAIRPDWGHGRVGSLPPVPAGRLLACDSTQPGRHRPHHGNPCDAQRLRKLARSGHVAGLSASHHADCVRGRCHVPGSIAAVPGDRGLNCGPRNFARRALRVASPCDYDVLHAPDH